MSNTSELERELRDLDEADAQRAQEATRRRELRQQIATEKEQDARADAERWLLANVRALGGAESTLDATLEKLRKNPNRRDTESANEQWNEIRQRIELAGVVMRRFPVCKAPALPEIAPPGRRDVQDVTGLSIETPRRQLIPVIIASDSPALRAALYAREAYLWLRGRVDSLPKELRGGAEVEVPEADLSARVAHQRAETRRQNEAAYQIARP